MGIRLLTQRDLLTANVFITQHWCSRVRREQNAKGQTCFSLLHIIHTSSLLLATKYLNYASYLYINTESFFVATNALEICTYLTASFYTKPICIDVTMLFATVCYFTYRTYMHIYINIHFLCHAVNSREKSWPFKKWRRLYVNLIHGPCYQCRVDFVVFLVTLCFVNQ